MVDLKCRLYRTNDVNTRHMTSSSRFSKPKRYNLEGTIFPPSFIVAALTLGRKKGGKGFFFKVFS